MSDQQTNVLLVEEVEKHPVLYNFYLPGYSKKSETEKAWNEVGNVVKLTAAECKERWKNIRAVFVRHMKPPKDGSNAKERKAYYLSDALQFTVPYIKTLGKPSGNLTQRPAEVEEQLTVEIENIIPEDDLLSETSIPSPSYLPLPKSPSYSSTSPSALPHHHQSMPGNHHIAKKKRAGSYDDLDKTSINYSTTIEARKEGLKMFLLSMLPDLMKMDDKEVRQFKRKTLDVVDDILSTTSR